MKESETIKNTKILPDNLKNAVEYEADGDTNNSCHAKRDWRKRKSEESEQYRIQNTAFLSSARIPRRVSRTCGDLLSPKLQ